MYSPACPTQSPGGPAAGTEIVDQIDAEAVDLYRRKFIRFERTGLGFSELKMMQKRWQEQHGDSTLHRRAFREPDAPDEAM